MNLYNILFICQHNVFRSQVAEAYFNQQSVPYARARSGGLFPHHDLEPAQVEIAKSMGINLTGKPKGITTKILGEQNLVVIVADCIPKGIIAPNIYNGPIEVWHTPDEPINHGNGTRIIISSIKDRIDLMAETLRRHDYDG